MSESLYATNSERALLGLLINDISGKALADCEGLLPEHFASEAHKAAFRTIENLTRRALPHDAKSVAAAMPEPFGGAQAVDELQAAAAHAKHFKTTPKAAAAAIKEGYARRGVAELAYRLTEMAQDGESSMQDIAAAVSSAAQLLSKQQVKKHPVRIYEAILRRTAYHEEVAAGNVKPGRSTGMHWLDKQLNGGLRDGKLVYVGARPGVGKSAWAMQVARRQAMDGHPTVFLSQEMPEDELADRTMVGEFDVSYSDMSAGQISNGDWGRIASGMDGVTDMPLYIVDQGGMTINDIRSYARTIPGLKNLVLDYLQLCAATSARQNRNVEIEEISRGLKGLAMELGITVIALSQLNRKIEERGDPEPQLSDLKDSGSIEQDGDIIIFLYPVRELQDNLLLVGCKVAKHRGGRSGGRTGMNFNGDRQRFTESTESIAPAPLAPKKRGFAA